MKNDEYQKLSKEEQKKVPFKNKPTGIKILSIVLGIFFIIVLPFTCFKGCNDSNTSVNSFTNINIDSLISILKKDNKDNSKILSYDEFKDIYYNSKDSSLNIAITNKNNDIKYKLYQSTPEYIDTAYHVNEIDAIEGIYIYEYKAGKSFSKGDYQKPLTFLSRKLAVRMDKFKKSGYVYNLKNYLEKNVNDPTGLEIINTWILQENEIGTFALKASFRAKNAFGALMIHTINCNMDMDGRVSKVEFDK